MCRSFFNKHGDPYAHKSVWIKGGKADPGAVRIHKFSSNARNILEYARQHHHNSCRRRKVYEDLPGSTGIHQDPSGSSTTCNYSSRFLNASMTEKNEITDNLTSELIFVFVLVVFLLTERNQKISRGEKVDSRGSQWILVNLD